MRLYGIMATKAFMVTNRRMCVTASSVKMVVDIRMKKNEP
jgi:hypothetical protein